MSPVIKPTVNDPACLDVRRIPAGMVDPVYDEEAGEGFATRDAANFNQCFSDCPNRACRQAKFCFAGGRLVGEGSCASPRFDDAVRLLAVRLAVHGINIRERHRVWACAGMMGADLPQSDPWPTEEELGLSPAEEKDRSQGEGPCRELKGGTGKTT